MNHSGQRKLTKKSHHHCTWTVQSYICQMSPMCTTTCFLGPIWVHTPNGISISSAVFAQLMAEGSYTLQRVIPIPLNIALVHGRSGPPSNTWFLGPTGVHNPNSISISLAVFARLMIVTDRPHYISNNRLETDRSSASASALAPKEG